MSDPARARILMALGDGRALAASVLAGEAGVAASTASAHLGRLVDGGLLRVERHGRHRYFRISGMLGTELMAALLRDGLLAGGDGVFDVDRAREDHLSAPGFDHDYRLTPDGVDRLGEFGIDFGSMPRRRPLIRYCVDWSEQRHHLAGSLGAALAERMFDLGWIRRADRSRAVHLSDAGREGLHQVFGAQAR